MFSSNNYTVFLEAQALIFPLPFNVLLSIFALIIVQYVCPFLRLNLSEYDHKIPNR